MNKKSLLVIGVVVLVAFGVWFYFDSQTNVRLSPAYPTYHSCSCSVPGWDDDWDNEPNIKVDTRGCYILDDGSCRGKCTKTRELSPGVSFIYQGLCQKSNKIQMQ